MSPKMEYEWVPEVDTPTFAWLPSGSAMPSSPMVLPAHVPLVAISTAPGLLSEASQHPITVLAVVVGISGLAHQVAARSETPPNNAETICHGGTCKSEGFEIKTTPLDSVSLVTILLGESFPSPATSA